MVARKLFVFFVVAALSLGLASAGLSGGMEVKGTVTKIEGSNVTIKDITGNENTVELKNPEALTNLKVGDKASVKHGILTKVGAPGPPPSPGPKY